MNRRVMHRPMFRKGGSAGEGITSGLQAPRQGYATNENNLVRFYWDYDPCFIPAHY